MSNYVILLLIGELFAASSCCGVCTNTRTESQKSFVFFIVHRFVSLVMSLSHINTIARSLSFRIIFQQSVTKLRIGTNIIASSRISKQQ